MRLHDVLGRTVTDVAEQTALLSLNAAIIAAQAGEHGRGFGVVAHSIKELSDRTRSSVASIGGIIRQVTDEADAAVAAVSRSRDVVVDGTRRTGDATAALETILADTSGATDRLEEIAVLTAEQLKGVREVADALARVSETIGQIRRAGQTQESAARQLQASARSLIDLAGSADATLDGQPRRPRRTRWHRRCCPRCRRGRAGPRRAERRRRPGGTLQAAVVAVVDAAALKTALDARAPDAVWVCGGAPLANAAIAEARERRLTTITLEPALLDSGIMLTVDGSGDTPKLVVHLGEARAAGVDFAADLLKLARVMSPGSRSPPSPSLPAPKATSTRLVRCRRARSPPPSTSSTCASSATTSPTSSTAPSTATPRSRPASSPSPSAAAPSCTRSMGPRRCRGWR